MTIQSRIFIWSQILIFIGLFSLFIYTSEIFYSDSYPNHIHKILYLDRAFDDEEVEYITQAAMSWTENTNHIAEVDVVRLPAREKIDLRDGIIVLKMNPDYPDIILMDSSNLDSTLGYYNRRSPIPCIGLVRGRIQDWELQMVMTHEIGHALGLKHITGEEGFGALMYPSIDLGANDITKKDLEQFCSLYHCDASKLKLQN